MTEHPTLHHQYAELVEALRQAWIVFRQDGKTSGRKGALTAVGAVMNFLIAFIEDEDDPAGSPSFDILMPLMALASALSDLDKGITAPMLEAAKAGNATTTGMLEHFSRAHAASAMECLMRSGLSRADAAKRVARAIEGRFYAQGFSRDLWRVVARWRDDLQAPSADQNLVGVKWYRYWVKLFQEFADRPNGRESLRGIAALLLEDESMAGYTIPPA